MIFSRQNVPEEHINCSYETYDWTDKEKLKVFLQEFITGERKGITFIGNPGVGKTHLLVSTYYALQHEGNYPGSDVIFWDWQMMMNWLRSGIDLNAKPDAVMEKMCLAPFILIDDIKPEPKGEFWKQMLELLLEYGYNNKTKLLLSTNADNHDELVDRWGLTDYHVSRLLSLTDIIVLRGKDRRA